jgi:hypothetical protein
MIPLFCSYKDKTYLLNYEGDGAFTLFNMKGVAVSKCKGSEIFPITVKQINGETLLLDAWMRRPVYFTTEIDLATSIATKHIKFDEDYEDDTSDRIKKEMIFSGVVPTI